MIADHNHLLRSLLKQIFNSSFQIVVILLSLGLLAAGIYGVINLDQEYDPNIFIPKDSYVKEYVDSFEANFPSQSVDDGYVYIGE